MKDVSLCFKNSFPAPDFKIFSLSLASCLEGKIFSVKKRERAVRFSGLIFSGLMLVESFFKITGQAYIDIIPVYTFESINSEHTGYCLDEETETNVSASCVPGTGIEPAHSCERQILSLLRLPIPPPGREEY